MNFVIMTVLAVSAINAIAATPLPVHDCVSAKPGSGPNQPITYNDPAKSPVQPPKENCIDKKMAAPELASPTVPPGV